MKIFPVDLNAQPRPYYSDAFNALHRGTDIFAPRGTPVLAVDDGTVRFAGDAKGGLVAYLTSTEGMKYYYAHLDSAIGQTPRKVHAGEIIGTVGNSGNAQGKATHLHFQVTDPNAGAIDPYPLLVALAPTRAADVPQPMLRKAQRQTSEPPPTNSAALVLVVFAAATAGLFFLGGPVG